MGRAGPHAPSACLWALLPLYRNPADAEDLTQDVFLKIYSNLASFDTSRGSLQVWITTMTRNLLVDNFRRTRNQRATGSLDDGWESDRGTEAD